MDVCGYCGRDVLCHISGRRLLYNEVIIVHPKCMFSSRFKAIPHTFIYYSICNFDKIFFHIQISFNHSLQNDKKYMSHLMGKPAMWFWNRFHTNRPAQPQKMARDWKFCI